MTGLSMVVSHMFVSKCSYSGGGGRLKEVSVFCGYLVNVGQKYDFLGF